MGNIIIKHVNDCVCLGGSIKDNGRVEVDVRRRIQAGPNAWQEVDGVIIV